MKSRIQEKLDFLTEDLKDFIEILANINEYKIDSFEELAGVCLEPLFFEEDRDAVKVVDEYFTAISAGEEFKEETRTKITNNVSKFFRENSTIKPDFRTQDLSKLGVGVKGRIIKLYIECVEMARILANTWNTISEIGRKTLVSKYTNLTMKVVENYYKIIRTSFSNKKMETASN
jgi:hypothetical protein